MTVGNWRVSPSWTMNSVDWFNHNFYGLGIGFVFWRDLSDTISKVTSYGYCPNSLTGIHLHLLDNISFMITALLSPWSVIFYLQPWKKRRHRNLDLKVTLFKFILFHRTGEQFYRISYENFANTSGICPVFLTFILQCSNIFFW